MTEGRGRRTEGRCQKALYFLPVMPDLIPAKDGILDRHPESHGIEIALDSPSTVLRVVSVSNHRLRGNDKGAPQDLELWKRIY